MSLSKSKLAGSLLVGVLLSVSCMEQYNPRPYWEKIEKERLQSETKIPKLTEDGKLPDAGAVVVESKYASLCASCHGDTGDGNGPAGSAMDPKPRDFTDGAWQNTVDEARIAKAITDGGVAVGVSATMPPWGAMLNESDVAILVKEIRAFGK